MKYSLLVFLFFICLISCTSDRKSDSSTSVVDKVSTSSVKTLDIANYEPLSGSIIYPRAEIESYSFEDGRFSFSLNDDSRYSLGSQTEDAEFKMCANSSKGQHLHLIVDNKPYAAKYTSEFEYDLPDGEHHLLAFLSRSYHESIKTDKAHVSDVITVKDGSITGKKAITEPMLFYSRPKGTYVGEKDAKRVMLDFYLVNAHLGSNYLVKLEVNDEDPKYINKWRPYYLDNLPMGENKVKLTLVDMKGNTVKTPLNPVSRSFVLKENPLND